MSTNAKSDKRLRKPPRHKPWMYGIMAAEAFQLYENATKVGILYRTPITRNLMSKEKAIAEIAIQKLLIPDAPGMVMFRTKKGLSGHWLIERCHG